MKHTLPLLLALLTALGCSPRSEKTSRGHASHTARASVAILGDDTRTSFRKGLLQAGCTTRSPWSASIDERIALLAKADACIVVVDSTQGPMPIHREDILLTNRFSRGPIFIAFSNTSLIDDPELLELEELELRELMNTYGLPGDTAEFFFDSERAKTPLPRGYSAAANVLRKIPKQPSPNTQPVTEGALPATIYCLTKEELFNKYLATTLRTGTFDLVFASGPTSALVQLDSPLSPGANSTGSVTVEKGTDIGPQGKFVIVKNNHVIAVGIAIRETH